MKQKKLTVFVFFIISAYCLIFNFSFAQKQAGFELLDLGKMWTFDYPPYQYFSQTYNLNLNKEWVEKAKLSSLRLPGCSGAFVSEDGLVITNHHCARGALLTVNKEGESLATNGFFAKTKEEERKVANFYIDQLVLTYDITKEIQQAFGSGKTDEEKVALRQKKMREMETRFKDSLGFVCYVVSFYNGGKYSMYGYKRYNDVRLVFAPETNLGFFGGDPDNFTYPRYCLDMSFFRIYDDNGQPLKTKNYFQWSKGGTKEGEPVFVVGNPGRTYRLNTFAQLEFSRDYSYALELEFLNNMISIYKKLIDKYPKESEKYKTSLFGYTNSQKIVENVMKGQRDPYLMGKKKDFEKTLKEKVISNPQLKIKYANLWNEIEEIQKEKSKIFYEYAILNFKRNGGSMAFGLASDLVEYAYQMKKSEAERDQKFKGQNLEKMKEGFPLKVNEIESGVLPFLLKKMVDVLGKDHAYLKNLIADGDKSAETLLNNTILTDKDKVKKLIESNPDDILKSDDPFISFVAGMKNKIIELKTKYEKLYSQEISKVQSLGLAMYEIFGTSIPPDGTFTLRISDGVVKGYEYNGTIAPPITTFYGLYDRYYSFDKKDPWLLPEKWQNPPKELRLNTPMNFVSTCDTYGGNSGSPILNKNLEVVGLNFDRNIEGMPREFIYTDQTGRNVGVHSEGMLEALKIIYKADRIVKELNEGKIAQ